MMERLGADKIEALRQETLAHQKLARSEVAKKLASKDRYHYKEYPGDMPEEANQEGEEQTAPADAVNDGPRQ